MDHVMKKLNLRGQKKIHVLNQPQSFEIHLNSISEEMTVRYEVAQHTPVEFAIMFAITQKELNDGINKIGPHLEGDATLWVCYPKTSSKKYTCEFNRDTGWDEFGKYDLEGVRQVAIDDDWSALRFRKIDYIKNFTRNKKMAISKKGKERSH